MAKAPPPGGKTAGEITIIVDGTKHPVRVDEITARDTGDLRRATGSSLKTVLRSMSNDMDIDTIAALVWLSRRQNGEPHLDYDIVASSINYLTDWDNADEADEDEDEDSPSR